jgi:hypothetical protein
MSISEDEQPLLPAGKVIIAKRRLSTAASSTPRNKVSSVGFFVGSRRMPPGRTEGHWGDQRAEVREVADGNRQRRYVRCDFQMFININICSRPQLSKGEIYSLSPCLAVLRSHRQTK